MRFSAGRGVYAWELRKGKRKLQVRVEGSWTFNCIYPVIDAAVAGGGRLLPVLKDRCPTFPGLHIFFASRGRLSPALSLIVEALRCRR